MPSTILKRHPRLRTSRDRERSAAWLELFFDLVFVLAVAELARYLQDNLNPGGFLGFAGLFVPVWWTWICFPCYVDQFDPDNVIYRIVMLVAMLFCIVLVVRWLALHAMRIVKLQNMPIWIMHRECILLCWLPGTSVLKRLVLTLAY